MRDPLAVLPPDLCCPNLSRGLGYDRLGWLFKLKLTEIKFSPIKFNGTSAISRAQRTHVPIDHHLTRHFHHHRKFFRSALVQVLTISLLHRHLLSEVCIPKSAFLVHLVNIYWASFTSEIFVDAARQRIRQGPPPSSCRLPPAWTVSFHHGLSASQGICFRMEVLVCLSSPWILPEEPLCPQNNLIALQHAARSSNTCPLPSPAFQPSLVPRAMPYLLPGVLLGAGPLAPPFQTTLSSEGTKPNRTSPCPLRDH